MVYAELDQLLIIPCPVADTGDVGHRFQQVGLDIEKLCEIGVKLGADVPFCIRKGTMLAEGIGEILTPLTPLTGIPVLLIKPNISISTPYVYKHLKLNELDYHPDNKAVISYIKDKNIKKIAASLSNVLETVTIPENPIIAELKRYLTEIGAIGSLMSGSGPTVFALFDNYEMALRAKEALLEWGQVPLVYVTDLYRVREETPVNYW